MSDREKARRTVSIDADLNDALNDMDVNVSALVNGFVREFVVEGRRPSMRDEHADQLTDQLDEIDEDVDVVFARLRGVLDQAKDVIEEGREADVGAGDGAETTAEIDQVHDQLTVVNELASIGTFVEWDRSPRDADHPAIETQADKLEIVPERLVAELEQRDRHEGYVDDGAVAVNGNGDDHE